MSCLFPQEMLKVIRSLAFGKASTLSLLHHHRHHLHHHRWHHHFLLFVPARQVVSNTVELAQLARQMGMDFSPDATLTSLIFSWSAPPQSPPTQVAALPFPSLSSSSFAALRHFARLSGGLFQVIFCNHDQTTMHINPANRNMPEHPSSPSLYSGRTGARIDDMAGLCWALAGGGWSLFQTGTCQGASAGYVFRKVDARRTIDESERVREMVLPELDFGRDVPLRILYYIILMADNLFYLA